MTRLNRSADREKPMSLPQGYECVPTECSHICATMQLVTKRRAQDCATRGYPPCKWHDHSGELYYAAVAAIVMDEAAEAGQLPWCFQEYPLSARDKNGRYSARMALSIDMCMVIAGRLIAVEVHGGGEHAKSRRAQTRDGWKAREWKALVQAGKTNSKWPQPVGEVLAIWAPGLQGSPLQYEEWRTLQP